MEPNTPSIPFFTAAADNGAVASSVVTAAPVTLAQLRAHLREHPEPLTCLPNGESLRMVASGAYMFERLTQSFVPEEFHDASIYLWCASRPPAYWVQSWTPSPQSNEGEGVKIPALDGFGMLAEAVAWRDAVLPVGGRLEVVGLAQRLWCCLHDVALEIDQTGLPQGQSEETGSPKQSTLSPAADEVETKP